MSSIMITLNVESLFLKIVFILSLKGSLNTNGNFFQNLPTGMLRAVSTVVLSALAVMLIRATSNTFGLSTDIFHMIKLLSMPDT